LRPFLAAWLWPLLDWLSSYLYSLIWTRCATHPLVRLAALYDPAPVVAACAPYHHAAGRGAPPTYPVSVLVRAEIVRVWAGSCSDPALERLLLADLVARAFVGLPLLGPTPDHSTLNRFHAWLAAHQPQALFTDVLAFLDRVDPEDPATTPQIVDTFALATPAAATGPSTILLGLCRQVVALWQTLAPPPAQAVLTGLDLAVLTQPPPTRTPAERQAALAQAAACAQTLQAALTPCVRDLPPAAQPAVTSLLTLLSKVLADETTRQPDGTVTETPAAQKGAYRLGSAVDVEATFRKHGPDPAVLGYNAAIATTRTRIRSAVLLPGSTPDSAAPTAVLAPQQAAGQPLPPYLIMDRAAGEGKTRLAVDVVSAGQTVLVAYTRPPSDATRFGPGDFMLDAAGTACRCPAGQVSTRSYHAATTGAQHFYFPAAQCRECPLWDRCRTPESKPTSHRTVTISPYQAHQRAAERFNASAAGQSLLRQRWRVEGVIAWLVRYDGGRRARRVGQAAAACHLAQVCAVRNLWSYLARRARRRPAGAAAPGRAA
jgi:hypothetical protein